MSPRAPSKQQRTYEVLRSRIMDGRYGPGYRLVIDAIARELEVSPMPVREAIRRLEAEGWVVYVRNTGAMVAEVDHGVWIETMSTMAILEGYATGLSAPFLGPSQLEELAAMNAEMAAAVEDFDLMRVAQINRGFHDAIYARCPSAHLRGLLAATQERLDAVRGTVFAAIPTRGAASVKEHERLLRMIADGCDERTIELVARDHKLHTVATYEQRMVQAAG